ncbi:MAG: hypothetical protein ACW99Q_26120, partial [Candidatus Kariarchaeaceae archaeon]
MLRRLKQGLASLILVGSIGIANAQTPTNTPTFVWPPYTPTPTKTETPRPIPTPDLRTPTPTPTQRIVELEPREYDVLVLSSHTIHRGN